MEKECGDSKSHLFYDSLFQRYLKGDSSFTFEEKQHLYYGAQFTSKYSPYGGTEFTDSLNKLLSKDKLGIEEYKVAIRYCDSILIEDPMDLKTLNIQANLFKLTNNFLEKAINMAKINNVIDAILSSGNGESEATAYYVICVDHEYSILNILDFEFAGDQSLRGSNDYLKLKKNKYNLEGIYFDVTASLENMEKMFNGK